MIDATRRNPPNPPKRRDSIILEICGEEDLTVIKNAPGFPTDEELERMGICPATGELIGRSEDPDDSGRR